MMTEFEKSFPDKPIFILMAPTASGKTSLSLALAKAFDFEIINADTYQFFRMMDIGTAKPTGEEFAQAPHHLFDTHDPDAVYSAHQYAKDAQKKVFEIFNRGKTPLLIGGSGFYIRAFLTPPSSLPEGTLELIDIEHTYQDILKKDPDLEKQIHVNDHYRISRAAFLLQQNILPSRAWKNEANQTIQNKVHLLSIHTPRDMLYERINTRVIEMFDQGLVQETQQILEKYPQARPRLLKTIGYQQVIYAMDGIYPMEEAISLTQQKTRNYAKRQMTWIRNQEAPQMAHFENAFEEISCYINNLRG